MKRSIRQFVVLIALLACPVLYAASGSATTGDVVVDTRSAIADLSSLTINHGPLTPEFAVSTLAYDVNVAHAVGSIAVTPTAVEANASIEVRVNDGSYTPVNSGGASGPLALNVGGNEVSVRVTAQNGSAQRTYLITVNRAKALQSLVFEGIGDRFVDEMPILTAVGGGSGNSVVFTVKSGPAVISNGNELTFTGNGIVTITASQDGNADHEAAAPVDMMFQVLTPLPEVLVSARFGPGVTVTQTGDQASFVSRGTRPVSANAAVSNRVSLPERRAVDLISVSGSKGTKFFTVGYFSGSGNVTAAIVGGTYLTPPLDETDGADLIRVQITPNKKKLTRRKGSRTVIMKKVFTTQIVARSTVFAPAVDSGAIRVQTK